MVVILGGSDLVVVSNGSDTDWLDWVFCGFVCFCLFPIFTMKGDAYDINSSLLLFYQ